MNVTDYAFTYSAIAGIEKLLTIIAELDSNSQLNLHSYRLALPHICKHFTCYRGLLQNSTQRVLVGLGFDIFYGSYGSGTKLILFIYLFELTVCVVWGGAMLDLLIIILLM